MRDTIRTWLRRLRIGAVLLLVLVVAVVGLLQLSPVATWAARRLVTLAPLNAGYALALERASGDWFGHLDLTGVTLLHEGRELARVDHLSARYSLSGLLGSPLTIGRIDVQGLKTTATRSSGGWDIAGALRTSSDTSGGTGLAIGRIGVTDASLLARLTPDSVLRVRRLSLLVRDLHTGSALTAKLDRLDAAISPPRSGRWLEISTRGGATERLFTLDPLRLQSERSHVAGRLVLPRSLGDRQALARLELELKAEPLDFADIAPLSSAVPDSGALRLDLSAGGRFDTLVGRAEAKMLRGTVAGASLELEGWITPLDSTPAYRLGGLARGVPGSPAAGRVLTGSAADSVFNLKFGVHGSGVTRTDARLAGRVDITVQGARRARAVGGATVAFAQGKLTARPLLSVFGGHVSGFAVASFGDSISYEVRSGRISGVDIGRFMRDTIVTPLNGRFSLAGTGTSPSTARVVADLRLDELRYGARHLDSVMTNLRLREGRAAITIEGELQGGRVRADLTAFPFDSSKPFTLRSATLDSVDLGQVMNQPALSGPISVRARAKGRWGKTLKDVAGRVDLEPSRLGRIEVTSGTLEASLRGARLTYELGLNTSGGSLTLGGEGRPFADAPVYTVRQGRADSLDLGDLLGRTGLRSQLNATFTATASSSWDSAEVTMLPSTVNDAEIAGGRLSLASHLDSVSAAFAMNGRDGRVTVRAAGRLADTASSLRTSGTLALEHLARWTGRAGRDGRIEGAFDFDATADSLGLRTIGGTASGIGGIGDVRVLSARAVVTANAGTLQVDTLELRSNVGELHGLGAVALRGDAPPGRLRLAARFTNVEPLASVTGSDTVSLDSGTVALELSGPARHWKFSGRGDAHSVVFAGNFAREIGLDASGTIDSTSFGALSGRLRVRNASYGKTIIPELTVSGRYDSLVALDAMVAVGDSLRLVTAVRGAVAGDTIRAVVQRLDLAESTRRWALAHPARLTLGKRIETDGLTLLSEGRRLSVRGVFDPSGSSDVTLGIRGLDLDGFRSTGLLPVGGDLDGQFHLMGRADDPTLEGKIGLAIRRPGGPVEGHLGADLLWKREGLRLNAIAAPTAGGRLTLSGTLPYRFTLAPADTSASIGVERGSVDTLGLAFKADSFGLSLFQPLLPPDVATDLTGTLSADGHISGRLKAPVATGTVALSNAGVTLPGLGVSYERSQLAGRLDRDELTIERLRLTTGKKQTLDGTGLVHLRPLDNPGLELEAQLHDFLVSNSPTLHSSASGHVRLTGTMTAPSLTGNVTVGPTDVFLGAEAAAAKVEPVELSPEDLRRLARDFGPSVLTSNEKGPGLMDRLRMDLQLRLPGRVWIRRRKSPEANIELSGSMALKQEPGGDMQFLGTVRPVPGRGSLDLSGRTFRLTGGTIELGGPVDSTRLDVTAEYQVPTQGGGEDEGVVIEVEAKGRLDSLGLAFTSDPQMSQEDVLSYIVTGHPASDNPLESGGQGFSGAQMAFGQLSQALASTAGKQLGFDVFQVKTDPASGLSLTAGRYLSSRFFLNLRLPLGRGSATLPGDNLGPGFELEYSAYRWLHADFRGGSLEPAVLLRGRHAY